MLRSKTVELGCISPSTDGQKNMKELQLTARDSICYTASMAQEKRKGKKV